MKRTKRVLSMVLALAMILALVPAVSSAAAGDPIELTINTAGKGYSFPPSNLGADRQPNGYDIYLTGSAMADGEIRLNLGKNLVDVSAISYDDSADGIEVDTDPAKTSTNVAEPFVTVKFTNDFVTDVKTQGAALLNTNNILNIVVTGGSLAGTYDVRLFPTAKVKVTAQGNGSVYRGMSEKDTYNLNGDISAAIKDKSTTSVYDHGDSLYYALVPDEGYEVTLTAKEAVSGNSFNLEKYDASQHASTLGKFVYKATAGTIDNAYSTPEEMATALNAKSGVQWYVLSNVDVAKEYEISATFTKIADPAPKEYTIKASADEGSTISPSGSVKVTEGKDQKFTIAAKDGYVIKDVKVDGKSKGAIASYTFPKVKANGTIAVTSEKKPEETKEYAKIGEWTKNSDGSWSATDANGDPITENWAQNKNGQWFYLGEDGKMATGWEKIDDTWYYLDKTNGDMKTDWVQDGSGWYYMKGSGAMVADGWVQTPNGKWYAMSESGKMREDWMKYKEKWYYLNPTNGDMALGWKQVSGTWYYLNFYNGDMREGWLQDNGKWYYLNQSSGAMAKGWKQVGDKWYYFYTNGAMAASTRVGGYRVGVDGAWIK